MKWYKVKVYFSNCIHFDEIRGNSPQEALTNAYWNWEYAKRIELV